MKKILSSGISILQETRSDFEVLKSINNKIDYIFPYLNESSKRESILVSNLNKKVEAVRARNNSPCVQTGNFSAVVRQFDRSTFLPFFHIFPCSISLVQHSSAHSTHWLTTTNENVSLSLFVVEPVFRCSTTGTVYRIRSRKSAENHEALVKRSSPLLSRVSVDYRLQRFLLIATHFVPFYCSISNQAIRRRSEGRKGNRK